MSAPSLGLMLLLLSGPQTPEPVARFDGAEVYRAYIYNAAMVDSSLQNRVVEIDGQLESINRTVSQKDGRKPAASHQPSRDESAAPSPTAVADGYDVILSVEVRQTNNSFIERQVRCRFPESAREQLAKLPIERQKIVLRGKCLGIGRDCEFQVGEAQFNSKLLEFTDCELLPAASSDGPTR
ncbi:MAG: hypothetical protein EXS05_11335 [Planctomycetaceae bacterium]|nr:hypothetical protein [Planctomycetaceae bacterium]